jgi:hypothetical protein
VYTLIWERSSPRPHTQSSLLAQFHNIKTPLAQSFYIVDYPNSKSNTLNLQIPLRYESDIDLQSDLLWENIGEEIEKLADLVTNSN